MIFRKSTHYFNLFNSRLRIKVEKSYIFKLYIMKFVGGVAIGLFVALLLQNMVQ